jgi:hypothetical protein
MASMFHGRATVAVPGTAVAFASFDALLQAPHEFAQEGDLDQGERERDRK